MAMEGLLRFLTDNQGYWQQKDQERNAEQFGGLLGTLEQQGPVQPGQGLLGAREPDQQFWLKAAQIPGYQNLAGQQLGYEAAGNQAMQRQVQGQDFAVNNMTLAQKAAQQLDELKAIQAHAINQADLARKWFGTQASAGASNASAAASNASRQLTGLKTQEQAHKNSLLGSDVPLFQTLPPAEKVKANKDMAQADMWEASVNDVEDWVENRAKGAAIKGLGTGEAASYAMEWNSSVRPMLQVLQNTGAPSESEKEAIDKMIRAPDDYVMTTTDIKTIQSLAQKTRDLRQNTYRGYGIQPQPIGVGQSSSSKALTRGKPKGGLSDVTERPGGSTTYSGTIDRR